ARSVRHMCLAGYVYAADLAKRGSERLYDADLYYRYQTQGGPEPTVRGIKPYIEDPFLYPPPFLLLPAAALALTQDYLTLRTEWFVIQTLGLFAVAIALAWWVGGRSGLVAGLLIPALWISIPFAFDLQYGQIQVAVVVLALGGMLLLERQRP